METKKIYFYQNNEKVYLELLLCDSRETFSIKKRPIVVICPGGGFNYLSEREAEPIARAYLGIGYHAAIIHFSVKENTDELFDHESGHILPFNETLKALSYIREHCEELNVVPSGIILAGVSAGGHLAALAALLSTAASRPDAVILGYPPITSDNPNHDSYLKNFLGKGDSPETRTLYSAEKQVKEGAPPFFIFHTSEDPRAVVENSILLANALANKGVTFEYHVFPKGKHGISTATDEVLEIRYPYVERWVKWSDEFLRKILNIRMEV